MRASTACICCFSRCCGCPRVHRRRRGTVSDNRSRRMLHRQLYRSLCFQGRSAIHRILLSRRQIINFITFTTKAARKIYFPGCLLFYYYNIITFAQFKSVDNSYTLPLFNPTTVGRNTNLGLLATTLAFSPLLRSTLVPTG